MKVQPTGRWDGETTLLCQLAAAGSLLAFLFYFRSGSLLLYGDAVAHINIARRTFDSQTPGLLQLGTVWLPLPHLLMIPFLISDAAWETGVGGAVPSMVAYVLGTIGMFRLVRGALSGSEAATSTARVAAWLAAIVYASNPNLLYLQATAMTEALYLALLIWSVVHFREFVEKASEGKTAASSSLTKCGLCLLGACLTRYDGWLLAAVVVLAAFVVVARSNSNLRSALVRFILLAAMGPVLWLGYNAIIYRHPLEFANGPYSARAIEQKSATPGMASYPGSHDPGLAYLYFFKSGETNLAEGKLQWVWAALLAAGCVAIFLSRRMRPLLLLGCPLIFYPLSVAYSGVPIFIPGWWPFSYYNVRYGLELLPAFAVALACLTYFDLVRAQSWMRLLVPVIIIVAVSYALIWRAQPICYREASINSGPRIALETELAINLRLLPHDATLLMYLGDHVGALQRAGIHLSRTINEGNHRPWAKPSDPGGLWERALADPRRYADYVIAFDRDPVASQIQKQDLKSIVAIHTTGQPQATIYWTGRSR